MMPFIVYGPATHLSNIQTSSNTSSFSSVQLCSSSAIASSQCESRHEDGSMSLIPLASLFLGNFLNGIGGTAYYVLGTTYLDDNVKKKNSALYLGMNF